MGIKQLAKLIADEAPNALKEADISSYFGRRVAIDASMSIYQFLIAIRQSANMMTNAAGETTSHLVGLFYRTCKMLEVGIKPVYVFDGEAPKLKSGELQKRFERREMSEQQLKDAIREEREEDIAKFTKRLVKVTKKHNEDCKTLLKLLGVPIIQSPSEAEAQCAQLAKEGLVYAIGTEDMDGLTFGTPRLVRALTVSGTEKLKEYTLEKVLDGLGLDYPKFIDLCILMGCDYCPSIKGIGGKTGLELIKKYGSIEGILKGKFGIEYQPIEVVIDYKERKLPEAPENVDLETAQLADEKPKDDGQSNGIKQEGGEQAPTSPNKLDLYSDDVKKENGEGQEATSASPTKPEKDSADIKEENGEEHVSEGDGESEEEGEQPAKKKPTKRGSGYQVPENWLFEGARKLFTDPKVDKNAYTEADLKIKDIDEEGLIKFLCEEHGFNEDRVKAAVKRVKESKGKTNQSRIDSFFKIMPSSTGPKKDAHPTEKKGSAGGVKRGGAAVGGSGGKRGRRPK